MRAGSDMLHLTLHLLRDDLPRAGLALAKLHAFAPDPRPRADDLLPESPGEGFSQCIADALGHYNRLAKLLDPYLEGLPPPDPPDPAALGQEPLLALRQWLKQAWEGASLFETAEHQINEQLRELLHLNKSLDELSGLDLDLGQLRDPHRFLDLHIGILPAENINNLRQALALSGHLIVKSTRELEQSRILIAGPQRPQDDLKDVLTAAGFQPLQIPETFRSSPDEVRAGLEQRRQQLAERQASLRQALGEWVRENGARLLQAKAVLDAARPYVATGGAAHAKGDLAELRGWLSRHHLEEARQILQGHLHSPFLLEARPPLPAEYHLVPVPPASRRWLRPFSLLVQQYGVPRFGEIDPTWLLTISFTLMFGMMFGDLGHGAVFLLLGFLYRRRFPYFAPPLMSAGAAAMVFGLLYGSVFGVEHWLPPLWLAPMSDPIRMLLYALGWGIGFITLGSILAISNRLHAGDHQGALYDPGGLFSLILYLTLIAGVYGLARGGGFNPLVALILLLSLGFLIARQWRDSSAPFGERVLVVLIETFEIVSGYFSNTLSFLRVAAFSINHVALSLAIFTLGDMIGGVGELLMLLVGNLFILVLEGAIVTIQILRLEYYEGFSRFFYGDGKPFTPLKYGPPVAAP